MKRSELKYNSRVTEIEQGTFTPLVFTTTGGMADECLRYHSRLAELLSAKKQESYAGFTNTPNLVYFTPKLFR